MAEKKQVKKKASGGQKGRVKPNVPRAGIKASGSRYCGGGKLKK